MEEVKRGIDLISLLNVQSDTKIAEYENSLNQIAEEDKREAYKTSGVGRKFLTESLDTFIPKTAEEERVKKLVIDFAKKPENRILLLWGENGTGKSHLGSGITFECGGKFITSTLLCVEYESGSDYHAKRNKLEVLKYYSELPMLVIDECCKFQRRDIEQMILSYIVCQRYENGLPTVLITNEEKKAFIDFLGRAVFDRMTEVCTSINFDWKSRRKERREVC